jgi:hypothetical protein
MSAPAVFGTGTGIVPATPLPKPWQFGTRSSGKETPPSKAFVNVADRWTSASSPRGFPDSASAAVVMRQLVRLQKEPDKMSRETGCGTDGHAGPRHNPLTRVPRQKCLPRRAMGWFSPTAGRRLGAAAHSLLSEGREAGEEERWQGGCKVERTKRAPVRALMELVGGPLPIRGRSFENQERTLMQRDNTYNQSRAPAGALPAGCPAPDFTLHTTPDQAVSLHDFCGQPVILAFYPADWSPVCGDQLTLYNEVLPEFRRFNAELLGISVDGVWCHLAYARDRKRARRQPSTSLFPTLLLFYLCDPYDPWLQIRVAKPVPDLPSPSSLLALLPGRRRGP